MNMRLFTLSKMRYAIVRNVVYLLWVAPYITHYPCLICTRLLLTSGIREINYISDYKNDELVTYFLEQSKVSIKKI